jgi:AhpD family alkylhydroperoxidase
MSDTSFPDQLKEFRQGVASLGKVEQDTVAAFQQLHKACVSEGELSVKTKELIALGIAIAIRCEGCIACHVEDALKAGATEKDITETISVAVLMGGGPSMVYGTKAHKALAEFAK